ncbi:MAG TPA: HEAT repeat domain-containing protein [Pyrinomonadaceae bacterium]|nr:HEAT repeat domain-containing protein [Pyrinomonadaceae bacterium]
MLLAVAGGDLASAQRPRSRQRARTPAAQQPASQRAPAQGQTAERPKHVFIGRGSDTARGSRMTITSDNPLNDYSAYRSGDRFFVELPNANADTVARAAARGYSDMQVQRRGKSVVLSYRIQPGAKPRVEQKFNRLDVVFDMPADATASAGNDASNRTTSPPANQNSNPTASNQTANQQTQTPATQNVTPGEKRPAQPAGAAGQQGTGAPVLTTPPGATEQPVGVGQNALDGAQPPAATETPLPTPPVEQQIASANPPGTIAPITTTNPATDATSAASGSTLGTYLLQNWWLALVIALVIVGLGLVFAARRTSAKPQVPLEESKATTKDKLDESPTTRLKDASSGASLSAVETGSAAALKPVVAASTVTVRESKNAKKKLKKKAEKAARKKGALAEELAVVAEPPVEAAAVEETTVEEPTVEEPAVEETAAEETTVEETAIEETAVAEPVATEPAVAESVIAETVATETVVVEPIAEEPVVAEPIADEPVVAEPIAAEPVAEEVAAADSAVEEAAVEDAPVEEVVVEDTTPAVEASEEVDAAEEVETASFATTEIVPATTLIAPAVLDAATSETGIAPVVALDPDNVQAEARRVLQGDAYDESVVGSSDSMARQMIAAELLSALAGRNPERRARARAAFVKHGYFDEKSRDLIEAEAPAERAAAARSLALVGDRAATPNLVAALEDRSIDVRRAAVEALGELRDPSAVAPLEALLERERKQRDRIPPRVIRNAVETCRAAAEEVRAQPAIAEPAAVIETAQAETPTFEEITSEATPVAESLEVAEPVAIETVAIEPAVEDIETVAVEPVVEDDASVAEAAPVAEAGPVESAEEATVELEPFEIARGEETAIEPASVEEIAFETAPVEEITNEIAPVEEASAISAIEAVPEAFEETPTSEVESHLFDEPQVLESAVSEPEEVVPETVQETGIRPFAESEDVDSTSIEFVEPSVTDSAVQDFESAAQEFEIAGPSVESKQVTLFDESATDAGDSFEIEEAIEEAPVVSPVESEDEGVAVADDEWVELDVRETHFGEQPVAVEPYNEIDMSAPVVEASPVETISKEVAPSEAESAIEEEVGGFEPAEKSIEESFAPARDAGSATVADFTEKGVAPFDEFSTVPASIQQKLGSRLAGERASAITELSHVDTDEAFQQICAAFDDEAREVRGAAARALYELREDRADSFTRALREATPERRRSIGSAISASGLAIEAISQLTGESREKTYEAFSLLFLMAKAGEVQPLIRAIEGHPNNEVRLAVVKLLALSGQKEILPAFRRLAVRGSLPTEVRSAVMEAIYQISSSQPSAA